MKLIRGGNMKSTFKGILPLMILMIFVGCNSQNKNPSRPKGPYFGQTPPGMVPQILAPGFISTEKNELNSAWTPDGKEYYYSIRKPEGGYSMWFTKAEKEGWSSPAPVSFNSEESDVDMCITYDGNRMYWGSMRPVKAGDPPVSDWHIWMVERDGDGWGSPKHLDGPVNGGSRSLYPSVTRSGSMYFQGIFPESFGGRDIYKSEYHDGHFHAPENVGDAVNTSYSEGDVLIAPDERFLVVCIGDKPDGYGKGDLYVSFKQSDGTWSKAKNMGETINTEHTEYCPALSPDGKYFFFTSGRTGNGDIYWVDAKIIDEMRPSNLK